jgi:hypothetical protein
MSEEVEYCINPSEPDFDEASGNIYIGEGESQEGLAATIRIEFRDWAFAEAEVEHAIEIARDYLAQQLCNHFNDLEKTKS